MYYDSLVIELCVSSAYLKLHVATPAAGKTDPQSVLFWRYLVELHVEMYLHQRIWYLFIYLCNGSTLGMLLWYAVERARCVFLHIQSNFFLHCMLDTQNVGYVV